MSQGLSETPEAEAARLIAADPRVRRILLFGSRAQGRATRASDMDLAIDAPEADFAALARWADLMDARESLIEADLHLLHELPEDLRATIARDGVVLFQRGA